MADSQAGTYKITSKDPFDGTQSVIIDYDPETQDPSEGLVAEIGEPVKLTAEQVDRLGARFNVEPSDEEPADESSDSESGGDDDKGVADTAALRKSAGGGGSVDLSKVGKGDTGSDAGGATSTPGGSAR